MSIKQNVKSMSTAIIIPLSWQRTLLCTGCIANHWLKNSSYEGLDYLIEGELVYCPFFFDFAYGMVPVYHMAYKLSSYLKLLPCWLGGFLLQLAIRLTLRQEVLIHNQLCNFYHG